MFPLHRRHWLQAAGLGLLGLSRSGFGSLLNAAEEKTAQQRRHCVVLWMTGLT